MDHEVWIELQEIKTAFNALMDSLSKNPEIKQQFLQDELIPAEKPKIQRR